ncbi:recombination protein RecR [bacterium]|nr:recombination protein RecR [bacterium]
MKFLPKSLKRVISEFERLPGVGSKTAERFAFYLLKRNSEDLKNFGQSIEKLKEGLVRCQTCFNISESNPCDICDNPNRTSSTLCIVEKPLDVVALEKTGHFSGVYHVLGGALSPIDGVNVEDLTINKLAKRLKKEDIKEIILATSATLEGESTAAYIGKVILKIKPEIKITRIARGLPVGGDLEFADEVTIIRALEGRREY